MRQIPQDISDKIIFIRQFCLVVCYHNITKTYRKRKDSISQVDRLWGRVEAWRGWTLNWRGSSQPPPTHWPPTNVFRFCVSVFAWIVKQIIAQREVFVVPIVRNKNSPFLLRQCGRKILTYFRLILTYFRLIVNIIVFEDYGSKDLGIERKKVHCHNYCHNTLPATV